MALTLHTPLHRLRIDRTRHGTEGPRSRVSLDRRGVCSIQTLRRRRQHQACGADRAQCRTKAERQCSRDDPLAHAAILRSLDDASRGPTSSRQTLERVSLHSAALEAGSAQVFHGRPKACHGPCVARHRPPQFGFLRDQKGVPNRPLRRIDSAERSWHTPYSAKFDESLPRT